jgi:hypothetical protein
MGDRDRITTTSFGSQMSNRQVCVWEAGWRSLKNIKTTTLDQSAGV